MAIRRDLQSSKPSILPESLRNLDDILVCPLCKADLELKPDDSGLKCVQCHRVYPIRDNIPVMMADQATVEE